MSPSALEPCMQQGSTDFYLALLSVGDFLSINQTIRNVKGTGTTKDIGYNNRIAAIKFKA